jgi:hypothetical protein
MARKADSLCSRIQRIHTKLETRELTIYTRISSSLFMELLERHSEVDNPFSINEANKERAMVLRKCVRRRIGKLLATRRVTYYLSCFFRVVLFYSYDSTGTSNVAVPVPVLYRYRCTVPVYRYQVVPVYLVRPKSRSTLQYPCVLHVRTAK